MSGGHVIITPPADAGFVPEDNIIIGNVSLYGATGGEVFIRGRAGERFCVRNSGATAVVEGVGDHGCEYMTRGLVVVLGPQGRNFGAGMSGGVAYVPGRRRHVQVALQFGMVELLPVHDEQDGRALRQLVQRHHQYTGSGVAERLLAAWPRALEQVRQGDADRVPQGARADAPRLGGDEARVDLTLLRGNAKKVGPSAHRGVAGQACRGLRKTATSSTPRHTCPVTCDASSSQFRNGCR
jgi:glutamate synthase domain-containing protein 3